MCKKKKRVIIKLIFILKENLFWILLYILLNRLIFYVMENHSKHFEPFFGTIENRNVHSKQQPAKISIFKSLFLFEFEYNYPKLCSFRRFWKLQLADCGFELFNYWWKLSREITYFSPIFFPFYFFLWSISSSFILWLNKEFFNRSWWLMFGLDYIETKVSQYYSLFCFNINTERWSHWQNYCLWIFESNHPNSINLRVNFIHITQLTRTSNSVRGNQTGLWVVAASHHFDVLLCHTHQTTEFSISEI